MARRCSQYISWDKNWRRVIKWTWDRRFIARLVGICACDLYTPPIVRVVIATSSPHRVYSYLPSHWRKYPLPSGGKIEICVFLIPPKPSWELLELFSNPKSKVEYSETTYCLLWILTQNFLLFRPYPKIEITKLLFVCGSLAVHVYYLHII